MQPSSSAEPSDGNFGGRSSVRHQHSVRASVIVGQCIDYIDRHLSERITLETLERITGSTPFQIIRAFRQEMNTTPHSYILSMRVRLGTEMLELGERAAEIAVCIGFVDQSHFIRHFKRSHGCSPRDYLGQRRAG
jgi:AraC-like DNA-binding protein